MIPYLALLLEITTNNGTITMDWKNAIVVPIHKGGDRSLVGQSNISGMQTDGACHSRLHTTSVGR